MAVSGPSRVFLTGGTGFIGAWTARDLLDTGRTVVVLTRDPSRLPLDLAARVVVARGDLVHPDTPLRVLLDGCDALVHCAKSDAPDAALRAEGDLDGTRRLLDAAVAARVSRIVYVSSIAAYGPTPDGVVDETFARVSTGDRYGTSKLTLEREMLARATDTQVVVVQPGAVYGAGPCWWGQGLLDLMRRGRLILVDDGEGTANLVHVRDVAQAIRRALDTPDINGECFLILDGHPVPWHKYYRGLECILGRPATLSLPVDQAKTLCRALGDRRLTARASRWLGRKLLGRPVIFPMADESIDAFARHTRFSIAKARARLGYCPKVDLDDGLQTVASHDRTRYPCPASDAQLVASVRDRAV